MLTAHTLNDRICAHSANAAHGMEIPPSTRILFCNGRVGAHLGGAMPENPRDQIEVIFERIRMIRAASGMTFRDVVRSPSASRTSPYWTIFSTYAGASWATTIPPATLLIVDGFPRSGVEVEIETIAGKAD